MRLKEPVGLGNLSIAGSLIIEEGLEAGVLELSGPGRKTGKLKSSRITVSGSLHVEKSIEGGRVEASRSLSIAETIEVENPSVSSLLTTVQKIWGSKRRKLQR